MSLGYSIESFWDQTPRTLALAFKASDMRLRREHNDRAWLAWWTAAMPRMKKFPKIEKLLARDARRKPQSVDQQWAILSAMAEASKVLRKN